MSGRTSAALLWAITAAIACDHVGQPIVSVDGAASCTVEPVTDYCQTVPHLPQAPVVDGVLECGMALRPVMPTAWTGAGSLPPGYSAMVGAAWRSDGLYVFASVTDPDRVPPPAGDEAYCGDGIEIFVDDDGTYATAGMYDQNGTRQFVVAAPIDDVTPSTRSSVVRQTVGLGSWTSTRYGTFPRRGGYTFEAFVGAADLGRTAWTLAAGGRIGFNVSLNVSVSPSGPSTPNTCGTRLGQYYLYAAMPYTCFPGNLPHCSTNGFCNPALAP